MYLEIDEGFPKHRKTLRLRSIMKDPRAGWYMVDLWTWACRSCPDGNLTGISSYEIEEAANYQPCDGKLCKAMIDSGFIDTDPDGNPVSIHNWAKRTGGAIEKMKKRSQGMKAYRAGRDWEVVRHEVIIRDKGRCTECGSTDELEVHHIIPLLKFKTKEAGNAKENLRTLCHQCHVKVERETRERDCTVTAQLQHGDVTNPTRPDQTSQDKTSPEDPPARDPGTTDTDAGVLTERWYGVFKAEWWKSKGRQYGQGNADVKAKVRLTELLSGLSDSERLADWNARGRFFSEFMAKADSSTTSAGWSFAFFVSDFNGLRVPPEKRPAKPANGNHPNQRQANYD